MEVIEKAGCCAEVCVEERVDADVKRRKNGNAGCGSNRSIADQHDLRHGERFGVRDRDERAAYLHDPGAPCGATV